MESKFEKLKRDFKHLYEYSTYLVNDVDDPEFKTMTEEVPEQQPAPQPEPVIPQQPTQNPQPEPVIPQQPAPQPEPVIPQQQNNDFYYKTIIPTINDLSIKFNQLTSKFDQIMSKMDYMSGVVDEIREPSNEEKLLAMTKQSYPFNKSMMDVWGSVNKVNDTIPSEIGDIKKNENGYELEVNLDDIQVPNMNQLNNFNKVY